MSPFETDGRSDLNDSSRISPLEAMPREVSVQDNGPPAGVPRQEAHFPSFRACRVTIGT